MANSSLRSTRSVLLKLIALRPGITRAEMLNSTGLPSGRIDPARLRLWKAGMIEPADEKGWLEALDHRMKDVGWQAVDDPDAQAEVRKRAMNRPERNAEPNAEDLAVKIVEALKDPVVNKLVLEMTKEGTGSRREQKRAAQALRAHESKRRREAEDAARDRAANANFKRNLVRLFEARGAVRAIDEFFIEERARVAKGEPRRVEDVDWALALNDVRQIMSSFGVMWQNLRDVGGRNEPCPACGSIPLEQTRALGSHVIDVEAIEEEIVEDGALSRQ